MTEKKPGFGAWKENRVGECGILRIAVDDRPDYEAKLNGLAIISLGKDHSFWEALMEFPSIQFGVEMAFLSLQSESPFLLFPSEFTEGVKSIQINGLVWWVKLLYKAANRRKN
jgi:hypothetical protein